MQRAALIALAFAVTPCLAAEAYPARNVRLVAPFAPGGTNDAVARVIVQQLAERLGKSFIVENRAGEGGVLANHIVAKAAPDGHMLLVTNPAFAMAVALFQSLPYDTLQSFTPVPEIMRAPNVLVIKPALSAKSLAEFIALARASVP